MPFIVLVKYKIILEIDLLFVVPTVKYVFFFVTDNPNINPIASKTILSNF